MSSRRRATLTGGTVVLATLALAGTAGPPAIAQDEEPEQDVPLVEEPADEGDEPEEAYDEVEPDEVDGDDGDAADETDEGEDDDVAGEERSLDVQAPNATLNVPVRARLRTLLTKGLTGRVTCAEPCSVLVELRRGGPRGPVVGHRSVRIPAAGARRTFHLRVDAKSRRLVRRTTATQLHLTAAAGDAAGNHRVVTRRVALRRRG